MQGKVMKPDPFKRMQGGDVTLDWLQNDETAMKEPIVIEKPDGLGMKMPEDITVSDVAEIVGENTPVEVIGSAVSAVCACMSNASQMSRRKRIFRDGRWANGRNTTTPSLRRGTRSATSFRWRSRERSSRTRCSLRD